MKLTGVYELIPWEVIQTWLNRLNDYTWGIDRENLKRIRKHWPKMTENEFVICTLMDHIDERIHFDDFIGTDYKPNPLTIEELDIDLQELYKLSQDRWLETDGNDDDQKAFKIRVEGQYEYFEKKYGNKSD